MTDDDTRATVAADFYICYSFVIIQTKHVLTLAPTKIPSTSKIKSWLKKIRYNLPTYLHKHMA